MKLDSKIFIAGHNGLVGSAILRRLQKEGYNNLITRNRSELDLMDFNAVKEFFAQQNPEYVVLAAAKVGGIKANTDYIADFTYENLQIQNNVIHCSYLYKVSKLIFLGSSCIYPKECPQPIKEEYILTGPLEQSNYGYAIAKIAGVKMCQAYKEQYGCNFISLMPTNMYGENDNFDLNTSHVLPALIRKFHEAKINDAKEVEVWGSGKPKREFLYADDLAEACLFIFNSDKAEGLINVGVGKDLTIAELAELIKNIVGFKGNIKFDSSKPDGTMRKVLDVSKINNLGWEARTKLEEGVRKAYDWYCGTINI
ncbi:MAG: GDP-L-fucose synthase [Proteobacteria bacterium]|nr:GDP-L-fucose synthase [Pseudomonadota bacterium]